MHIRTVVAAVRIARDAVPMVRRGISQTSDGHRRAWHNLIASRDDRCLQHPQQLVRVTIRVATGTRKGTRRRSRSCVKCDASSFHRRMGRIFEFHSSLHLRSLHILDIDERHRICDGIQHPGMSGSSLSIAYESDTAGHSSNRNSPQYLPIFCIDGEQLVGSRSGNKKRFVIVADFNRKGSRQGHSLGGMRGRQRLQIKELCFLSLISLERDLGNLVEEGPVFHLCQTVIFRTRSTIHLISSIRLCDKHLSFGVNREAVQKCSKRIDHLDQLIGRRIEHIEIPIGNTRMLDDIDNRS